MFFNKYVHELVTIDDDNIFIYLHIYITNMLEEGWNRTHFSQVRILYPKELSVAMFCDVSAR